MTVWCRNPARSSPADSRLKGSSDRVGPFRRLHARGVRGGSTGRCGRGRPTRGHRHTRAQHRAPVPAASRGLRIARGPPVPRAGHRHGVRRAPRTADLGPDPRAGRLVGRGSRGPGRRARGPCRHRLDHSGGVGPRRPRHHDRRCGDDDDLPDHARRRRGLHRRRLRQQGRLRRERGAGPEAARPSRRAARAAPRRHLRRQAGRRRGRDGRLGHRRRPPGRAG